MSIWVFICELITAPAFKSSITEGSYPNFTFADIFYYGEFDTNNIKVKYEVEDEGIIYNIKLTGSDISNISESVSATTYSKNFSFEPDPNKNTQILFSAKDNMQNERSKKVYIHHDLITPEMDKFEVKGSYICSFEDEIIGQIVERRVCHKGRMFTLDAKFSDSASGVKYINVKQYQQMNASVVYYEETFNTNDISIPLTCANNDFLINLTSCDQVGNCTYQEAIGIEAADLNKFENECK